MLFPQVKSYSHCCVHLNCLARCRGWEESQENRWSLQIINENFSTLQLFISRFSTDFLLDLRLGVNGDFGYLVQSGGSCLTLVLHFFCSLWMMWKMCPSYPVLVNSRSFYSKHYTGKLSSLSVQWEEELFIWTEYFLGALGELVRKFGCKYLVAVTIGYVV